MCSASQGRVSNQKERRMKVFTQPAIAQTASPSYRQPIVSHAASTQPHQIGSSISTLGDSLKAFHGSLNSL